MPFQRHLPFYIDRTNSLKKTLPEKTKEEKKRRMKKEKRRERRGKRESRSERVAAVGRRFPGAPWSPGIYAYTLLRPG